MEDKWVFKPYKAVGPILFGMNRDEVKEKLGDPKKSIMTRYGNLEEIRDGNIITYSKKNEFVDEVSCLPGRAVYYKGKNLQVRNLKINILKAEGDNLYEYMGTVVSHKLGIAMAGIHEDDEYSITFFNRGYWEPLKYKLSPFKWSD